MVRPDLSAKQAEDMAKEYGPGSAARYLEERRREIEEEKQKQREEDDYNRFRDAFVAAGGTYTGAKEAWMTKRDDEALKAAREADEAALLRSRSHMRGVL